MMMTPIALLVAAMMQTSQPTPPPTPPGEEAVKPYVIINDNAGAAPFEGDAVYKAFGGLEAIERVADELVTLIKTDDRLKDILRASDKVRLRRTLKEQFCYLLGGPCDYTGRDMASVHEEHGITMREYLILVDLLQAAMNKHDIPFGAQTKLLGKLAPMYREVVTR